MSNQESLAGELWLPVPGWENYYEVSNLGRVKSLPRTIPHSKFGVVRIPGKIMHASNAAGYRALNLSRDKKDTRSLVHRLVAMAFIPNPNNYPHINHINCNRADNRVGNLEWCNQSQNQYHAYRNGLRPATDDLKGAKGFTNVKNRKPVLQYSIDGSFIREWRSLTEAHNETKIRLSGISQVCTGKIKEAGNFIWKFKDERQVA